MIDIISPVREDGSNTYDVEIELGDLRDRSQDIGITLKHGTYVIRCVSNSEPELITYRKITENGSGLSSSIEKHSAA